LQEDEVRALVDGWRVRKRCLKGLKKNVERKNNKKSVDEFRDRMSITSYGEAGESVAVY